MRRTIGLASLLALSLLASPSAFAQQNPNVVFILADNVGYGDLGPYGGGELHGAPTPRIDQLARLIVPAAFLAPLQAKTQKKPNT